MAVNMETSRPVPAAMQRMVSQPTGRRRVVVIGGGLIGTATAYAAARIGGDGVRVSLYEAATLGHEGGASIDVTRVFRHAYGESAHYTRWAQEALKLWHDLEEGTGRSLFCRTGAAWIASTDEQRAASTGLERLVSPGAALHMLQASFQTMRAVGLPCELVDGAEVRRRYPQFASDTIAAALVDPGAGMLFARDAVLALREACLRYGVELHEGQPITEVQPQRGGCAVRAANGTSVEADVVVLAINGWTGRLLPDLAARLPVPEGARGYTFGPGLQNTEQPLFYFALPAGVAEELAPGRFPVFLFANADVYGLPAHLGAVKVANDGAARLLDQPEQRRLAGDAYRQQLHEFLVRQLPVLRSAALLQERVCFYDRSPDGHFVLDQWDGDARLIVACGFSGHGFKFGPVTGARLARYALSGQRPPDLVPFSLMRFHRRPDAAA